MEVTEENKEGSTRCCSTRSAGRKTAVKAQLREGQAVHRAIDGSSNADVKYDTVTGLADTFFKQNFFLSILIRSCSAEFDNLAQQGVGRFDRMGWILLITLEDKLSRPQSCTCWLHSHSKRLRAALRVCMITLFCESVDVFMYALRQKNML